MKDENTNRTLFIALYHHRHGVDCLPYFLSEGEALTEADVIESLIDEGVWEGKGTEENREDEWVEVQKIDIGKHRILRLAG